MSGSVAVICHASRTEGGGHSCRSFYVLAGPLISRIRIDCALFVLQKVPVVKEDDEPEEEDEEEMGHAETYAEYMPIKCMSWDFQNNERRPCSS